jgi:PAS domain S-box-containing protein
VEQRERQLRLVTDNAPVLLLQYDAQGRYVFANETFAALVGRRPHEVIGRTVGDILGAAAQERLAPRMREALEGRAVEFDERIPYPAAGERWMHVSYLPQRGPDGRPAGFYAVAQDITERKQAELRLEEQATRFEKLSDVGLALAAESGIERVVQAVTDAATQLCAAEFGAFFYNVARPDGESYMLYTLSGVPREHFERFPMPRNTKVFGPTFRGEGIVRVDDIRRDPRYGHNAPYHGMPEGHLPVSSYLAVPVVSRSGEVLGGLFFGHSQPGRFTEAAERIVAGIAAQAAVAIDNARLHEQRLRLIADLQESDRRKDEFIATLSHELRNPLAPLRNALHVVQMKRDAGDDLLPMMSRQVNQLVRLVDDLLEVSRINRGELVLRKERVELHHVVRDAVEAVEPQLRERGQAFDLQLPDAPVWIEADGARVAQVLSNLLGNASRCTDAGGRISLAARVEDGSRLSIAVRDTGVGFERADGERFFEMFVRGERSQGLGIGLALARRLAQMHGGTLTGESDGPGRGATFTLALPLPAQQPRPAAGRVHGPQSLPPIKVLVVDDNEDAANTLHELLDLLGARASVAHEGLAALASFERDPPDAVLLDIGMPGLDGYQVARLLRERHPRWPGALIALTGWGQESDRRKGKEAGFDHHLVKPVDVDALHRLLSTVGVTAGERS